ncbi:MAG: hypothetical protein ACK5JT_07440 [Hyphomicrobiaceae bacterium]
MTNDLTRLIAQYRWLRSQDPETEVISGATGRSSTTDAMQKIFLEIVCYPSDDPRVSYIQIAFLVDVMANAEDNDPEARQFLRDTVLDHVRRLTDQAAKDANPPGGWLS